MNDKEQLVIKIKRLEKLSAFLILKVILLISAYWVLINLVGPDSTGADFFSLVLVSSTFISIFITMYVGMICKLLLDIVKLS